jgi:hypothetical protein
VRPITETTSMTLKHQKVGDVMTKFEKVYTLEFHRNLDFNVLSEIFKSGYVA